MPNADPLGQPAGVGDFGTRHAGAVGGDGDGMVAEGELRRLGDDGAVDAAAEGDRRRAEAAQHLQRRSRLAVCSGVSDGAMRASI